MQANLFLSLSLSLSLSPPKMPKTYFQQVSQVGCFILLHVKHAYVCYTDNQFQFLRLCCTDHEFVTQSFKIRESSGIFDIF